MQISGDWPKLQLKFVQRKNKIVVKNYLKTLCNLF